MIPEIEVIGNTSDEEMLCKEGKGLVIKIA